MRRAACAAGLAVIALTGCSGTDEPQASSTPAATVTVTATPSPSSSSSSVPAAPSTDGEQGYDAARDQPFETPIDSTKAQRADCAKPGDSVVDRVLSAQPARGAGAAVQRAVAYDDGATTFVGVVSDVGTGTWAVTSAYGVLALDQDSADLSGYPLALERQHETVDPDNAGRGRLITCLQRGFPGDERAAG